MPIIDRYLLGQFLRVFVICFCSLTGLFAVFDTFSNLDDFLNYAEKHGNLVKVMGQYYGYRSVALFDRMSGVLALTAAMFTITWFQRFNEFTALTAAGIRPARILAPIVYAAVALSVLAATNRELLMPQLRDELGRDAKDLAGDQAMEMKPRYDNVTEVLIRGHRTFAAQKRIYLPDFLLPPSLDAHGRRLVADNAYYFPAAKGRPSCYLMERVSQPRGLAERESLKLNNRMVLMTPRDFPWLADDQCFLASEVNFEQLTGGQTWRFFSSTWTLIQGLRNRSLDFGADVRVTIHSRFVQPLLDVTLLFLGLPLLLSRGNRNLFASIGLCVLVVCGFMLVVFGSQHLGAAYLISPALAAWLPLMIFVPVAVVISEPLLT